MQEFWFWGAYFFRARIFPETVLSCPLFTGTFLERFFFAPFLRLTSESRPSVGVCFPEHVSPFFRGRDIFLTACDVPRIFFFLCAKSFFPAGKLSISPQAGCGPVGCAIVRPLQRCGRGRSLFSGGADTSSLAGSFSFMASPTFHFRATERHSLLWEQSTACT